MVKWMLPATMCLMSAPGGAATMFGDVRLFQAASFDASSGVQIGRVVFEYDDLPLAFSSQSPVVSAPAELIAGSLSFANTTYTDIGVLTSWSYYGGPQQPQGPTFTIGGGLNGVGSLVSGTDDFFLYGISQPAAEARTTICYTTATPNLGGCGYVFYSFQTSLASPFGSSVPEPSTWAMLIAGMAALGGAVRWFRARVPTPADA